MCCYLFVCFAAVFLNFLFCVLVLPFVFLNLLMWFCCCILWFAVTFYLVIVFYYWFTGHCNMQIWINCHGTLNTDTETTTSHISAEIIQHLMDDFESSLRHQQSVFICEFSLHSVRIEIRPWLWEYPSVLADKALQRTNLFRSRPAVSICFPHAIEDGSTCCDNPTANAPHVSLP